jgi:hypothetical protein
LLVSGHRFTACFRLSLAAVERRRKDFPWLRWHKPRWITGDPIAPPVALDFEAGHSVFGQPPLQTPPCRLANERPGALCGDFCRKLNAIALGSPRRLMYISNRPLDLNHTLGIVPRLECYVEQVFSVGRLFLALVNEQHPAGVWPGAAIRARRSGWRNLRRPRDSIWRIPGRAKHRLGSHERPGGGD